MPGSLNSRLFARIITRNRDVYLLKILTLAVAFASSILITVFSLNEFGYDRFHKSPEALFRVIQRNTDEAYSGNRLSAKIPSEVVNRLSETPGGSLVISRVKIMNKITVAALNKSYRDQKVHAADPTIANIFSFDIMHGDVRRFATSNDLTCLLSARAAKEYIGDTNAAGKHITLYSSDDSVLVMIAAVFRDFPQNSHESFDLFLRYDTTAIQALGFDSNESGVYGKVFNGEAADYEVALDQFAIASKLTYQLQPLMQLYFGARILGEDARHGDAYSITLLICIATLILFLALSSFINLTTLSLPHRSKEIAVKKLAGMSQQGLLFSFLKESFLLVGVSLAIGILVLILLSGYIEPILRLHMRALLLSGDAELVLIVALLFLVLAISPLFMVLRFIHATPNRLLSTDTIGFPRLKSIIAFLQLGISIFLIVASVVVRRQINYSLLKEPGRNHDQVVYLNPPSGITNEGIAALRSGWKKYNPNIVDVMAVSQLPDRISSKEIGSEFYALQVDAGFLDFFNLNMKKGNWFRANAGDSIIVTNKKGKTLMGADTANVLGVIEDFSGRFNQPEKPVKIRLASDFNYNWLCVRVLEVDIRRTVSRLSDQFGSAGKNTPVYYLNRGFEEWLRYQDRLNLLSGTLAIISALLSCCAIYGLSVSIVRDKLKQIAVHKLYGAHVFHIVRLLITEFAKQMLLALIVFAPVTYIFLNELLRTFVYATELQWLDPVYPIGYCAFVITALCVFQALNLNRTDLTKVLKG